MDKKDWVVASPEERKEAIQETAASVDAFCKLDGRQLLQQCRDLGMIKKEAAEESGGPD